jgi:GT2 family glycosyltransferase
MPEISVVLTTDNGAPRLPVVLASLVAQSLSATRFEVIAVDSGSSDSTQELLQGWAERLPLRVVRQNKVEPAAAKTLGLFLARSGIVLFLSDDAVADADLLAEHLASHAAHPEPQIAVTSSIVTVAEMAGRPAIWDLLERVDRRNGSDTVVREETSDPMAFGRGPTSFKRTLLTRHGVFRPGFRLGYEDVELACRLGSHGLRLLIAPCARATKIGCVTFDDACARCYVQGQMRFWLTKLHDTPGLRAAFGIEAAIKLWLRGRSGYASRLRWTRKLHRLVQARHSLGLSLDPLLERTLGAAFEESFLLSRAKGLSDATDLAQAPARGPEACALDYSGAGRNDYDAGTVLVLKSISVKLRRGAS